MLYKMKTAGKPYRTVLFGKAAEELAKKKATKAPAAVPEPVIIPKAPKTLWAFTDGSWSAGKPNVFGASYILVERDGKESRVVGEWSKASNNEEYLGSRNVAGEVYAAIYAMNWAKRNNRPIVICHDYTGIAKWCLGEWKTNRPISKLLLDAYKKMPEGMVKFRKVAAHSGNQFNDKADELAKAAVAGFIG